MEVEIDGEEETGCQEVNGLQSLNERSLRYSAGSCCLSSRPGTGGTDEAARTPVKFTLFWNRD